jgi:TPP-dependent pyruvate/acetoin dehydrogenase alpha subunit
LVVPWLRGRPLVQVMACVIQTRLSPTGGRLYGSFAGGMELGVMPFITNVLGPNIAVATGMALSYKLRSHDSVAVVAFGDGTSGTGDFHESLNMGNALRVPVVYVCQNNGYSISTPDKASLACSSIADWGSRYGMPAAAVDGNDVLAVADAVKAGIARARAGNGPSFIEARTMRRSGHFWADPAKYMSPEQIRDWEAEDPIRRLERVMLARGALADELKAVWAEAAAEVAQAVREAAGGPPLTASDLGTQEVLEHVG